jgi:hypothetical protein
MRRLPWIKTIEWSGSGDSPGGKNNQRSTTMQAINTNEMRGLERVGIGLASHSRRRAMNMTTTQGAKANNGGRRHSSGERENKKRELPAHGIYIAHENNNERSV